MTSNPKLSRFNSENVPPEDPNIHVCELPSIVKESTGNVSVPGKKATELETQQNAEVPSHQDPPVKVQIDSVLFCFFRNYI